MFDNLCLLLNTQVRQPSTTALCRTLFELKVSADAETFLLPQRDPAGLPTFFGTFEASRRCLKMLSYALILQ